MSREINKLTSRKVASLKEYGLYADGGGLYLKIAPDGSHRWVFIYISDGRRREMGFGAAAGPKKAGLTLADARRKAENARRLRFEGKDPFTESRVTHTASKTKTFGEFADELLSDILKEFRNAVHRNQWKSTLEVYA